MAESELVSPLSPRIADLNLSDYYTIATVLDQSPDDRNDLLTSFANPNYGLDAINSNLFISSYDEDHESQNGGSIDNTTPPDADDVIALSNPEQDLIDDGSEIATNHVEKAEVGAAKRARSLSMKSSTGSVPNSDEEEDADAKGFESTLPQLKVENSGDVSNTTYHVNAASDDLTGIAQTTTVASSKSEADGSLRKTVTLTGDAKKSSVFQEIYSPDSNDSGIQADVSQTRLSPGDSSAAIYPSTEQNGNADILEKSELQRNETSMSNACQTENDAANCSSYDEATGNGGHVKDNKVLENPPVDVLPHGWQKHEDSAGAYYWHIKSGTIQRERPSNDQFVAADQTSSAKPCQDSMNSNSISSSVAADSVNTEIDSVVSVVQTSQKKDDPRTPVGSAAEEDGATYPMRFAVRSLGWVQISEDDLTPERSSRSVNKCIVGLSLGKNDLNDVVGRWGDGKSLYLELDEENLVLIDPQDMCILNIQPIHSIRVWGVGRSNGSDFAYVARDSVTHKHMCHVFRCDGLARHIASALRDVCKKILTERSLRHESSLVAGAQTSSGIIRPNNLPNLERIRDPPNGQHITFDSLYKNTSFPTPMEEPKKILRCHYLGTTIVLRPTGVETVNSAIENVYMRLSPDKWTYVNVAVAPSTITISEHGKPENVFAECRVRFLSFMGIAMNNIRLCSFIMHCAQDQFIAHIFHCDPSAGALCKTIEAACKLRYQKCLDAHHRCRPYNKTLKQEHQAKSFGNSLRHGVQTMIGNLTKGCKPKS